MSNILQIDRSRLFKVTDFEFNPNYFTIWKGSPDGDGLEGQEDQDSDSLALESLDLNEVQLVSVLRKGELWIQGEERVKRLKEANYILLDARILQEVIKHPKLVPESWKKHDPIHFDGTVIHQLVDRTRRVLSLRACGISIHTGWLMNHYGLASDCYIDEVSAVLRRRAN